MAEKKVKKVKKGDKVVEMEEVSEKPKPQAEDYDALKKRYFDLKKRYDELEKAFNRISTLEDDIKKVHQKLDSIDANSANVEKDLAAVKSRVAGVSKDMKAITVVARNISQKYGFEFKVAEAQGPPAKPQAKPAAPQQKQLPQRHPDGPITKAAKALAMARNAEPKRGSEEITAQPGRGKPVEPKDHKDAAKRMDDVFVSGDDDMDTVDYLVRPDGKKVPLDKKKVEEELKENEKEE